MNQKRTFEASNPDIMYPSNPSQVAARHAAQSLSEIWFFILFPPSKCQFGAASALVRLPCRRLWADAAHLAGWISHHCQDILLPLWRSRRLAIGQPYLWPNGFRARLFDLRACGNKRLKTGTPAGGVTPEDAGGVAAGWRLRFLSFALREARIGRDPEARAAWRQSRRNDWRPGSPKCGISWSQISLRLCSFLLWVALPKDSRPEMARLQNYHATPQLAASAIGPCASAT